MNKIMIGLFILSQYSFAYSEAIIKEKNTTELKTYKIELLIETKTQESLLSKDECVPVSKTEKEIIDYVVHLKKPHKIVSWQYTDTASLKSCPETATLTAQVIYLSE